MTLHLLTQYSVRPSILSLSRDINNAARSRVIVIITCGVIYTGMTTKNIKIHLPYGDLSAFGPGKADLLEAIQRTGSISAAARDMGMSYKRAWDLVDTMNKSFRAPLVDTATGGSHGGGAQMSEFGAEVLQRYRDIELKSYQAVEVDLKALAGFLEPRQ